MRVLIATLLATVSLVSACGSSERAPGTREIVGVVINIDTGSGFGEVESFTVKEGDHEFEIFVDPSATYEFPLAHLNSHRAGAEPVRVEAQTRDGKLVAISIGDA